MSRALRGFEDWSRRSIEERAPCLERLADLLERDRDMLMRIAVQEAKKTIPDALAEVREAVDFCRYYAAQARTDLQPVELPGPTGERNVIRMEGRGAWVCIAPWNFPLAIFLGQVIGGAGGRQQRRRQARLADARDRRLCGRPRPCGGHSRGRADPRRRPAATSARN